MLWKYAPYMFNRFKDDQVFIKNVWTDLKPQLPKELQNKEFPKDFTKLFVAMRVASESLKLQKSEYNKSHKKEIEKEKNERKEKYGYCYKNGEKTEMVSDRF